MDNTTSDQTPHLPEPDPRRRYEGGLDYWSFTHTVRSTLTDEAPEANHDATSLALALVRGANTFTHSMETVVHRPAGRNWATYQLLYTLWLAGDMYPSEAAALTDMSRAAMTGLTSKLTTEGLLEKIPTPEDGRSHLLHLTPAGVAEAQSLYRTQNHQESRWAASLTDEEQAIMLILLDKLLSGDAASEARRLR